MLRFTTEERNQALAELAELGIQNQLGVNSRDAVALLGHIVQMLTFAIVLRPEICTPSMRVSLAAYRVFKHGSVVGLEWDEVTDATAAPPPPEDLPLRLPSHWFSECSDDQLRSIANKLRELA